MPENLNETALQKEIKRRNLALQEKFKQYVGPLKEAKGAKFDDFAMNTVLTLLGNLDENINAMSEATQSTNVGTFIQHGYDLIASIYPNLVANLIASIQPLQYRSGEVWYYDLVVDQARGAVAADTKLLDARNGPDLLNFYGTELIRAVVNETPNAVITTFTGTIAAPVRTDAGLDFFFATDGVEVFAPDPSDFTVLVGSEGGTGTLNLTTGAYSVTFNAAPAATATVEVLIKVNLETNPGLTGRTKIQLNPEPIEAQKHRLISDYTLDAEYDLQKNFNMNISDELVRANSAIIRGELDQLIMDEIKRAAQSADGAGTGNFDATVPAGVSQIDHFRTFLTVIKDLSNAIYQKTKMVHGNYVIVGSNAATILEILPEFKANPAVSSDLQAAGPYVAGKIGEMLIIKNPYYDPDEYVVGNRGRSVFNTGYILAPYKGLMVTPPISDTDNPFSVTRGLWLEAGRKVVNSGFYASGRVSNFNP